MGRSLFRDIDAFASGLDELIGDIPDNCNDGLARAVTQSVRKAASELRSGAYGSGGRHAWSEDYMGGFQSHVERGGEIVGEVGNKNKPGLVHLLEKGHATLTGRRTAAYPHMEPAFESMQQDFIERADKAIGEALEG